MVKVTEKERSIIIDDQDNGLRVQFDFYEDLGIFFNMDIHDYYYGDGFTSGDDIIIGIDRYEDSLLYEILEPFFKDQTSYSFVSTHPLQSLRDGETPNTLTITKNYLGISICLEKNLREFSDNVYLDDASENVERFRILYYYFSVYLQLKKIGQRLILRSKRAGAEDED